MFKKYVMILMVLMFMCVGCKQMTFNTVNLADLDEFEYSNEPMIAIPAIMAFEIPSEKDYVKSNQFLQETLKKYFLEPKNMQFKEKNSRSMVYVDILVPVFKSSVAKEPTAYYFIYEKSSLKLKLSEPALAMLNSDIKKAYGTGLVMIKDMEFLLKIVNNGEVGYKFNLPYPVFYNDKASAGGNFELAPGESSIVQVSNVLTDLSTERPIEILKM